MSSNESVLVFFIFYLVFPVKTVSLCFIFFFYLYKCFLDSESNCGASIVQQTPLIRKTTVLPWEQQRKC